MGQMMIKVNADAVLKILLEHQPFFFGLLDEMDKHNGILPTAFYREQFHCESEKISEEVEKTRWQNAMKPENLEYCGLLEAWDRSGGWMKWQGFVTDMFPHFDKRRLRRLTDPYLQDFSERLTSAYDRLSALSGRAGSSDWQEAVMPAFELLHEIAARIRENTESLHYRAEHLAEIIEKHDVSDWEQTERTDKAFDEIRTLYTRAILPALQFLNEDEPFKAARAPMQTISLIEAVFSDRGQKTTANRVLNIKNGIRSFAKDIEQIRHSMEHYVRQSDIQRMQYDTVETLYNRLCEEVQKRYDGKLRNAKSDIQTALLPQFPHFSDLKTRRVEPRINWQPHQKVLFDEHLRVALSRPKTTNRPPVRADTDPQARQANLLQRQHQERLKQAVKQFGLPENGADLQSSLHIYLMRNLPYYTLPDLIDAASWFHIHRPNLPLYHVFGLKTLHYKNKILRYHPIYPMYPTEQP
ncbi:hypothetical protein H9Q10_08955 [Eikenella sp. S3360]|uniref:DUF3375 domain-containing protein n=1 Tax=Eikenella glucosivorans TaxID=2766967 RepID=A0ABS0NBU6_9NEIS|nr:hypothetical protein [Eikenella glucosivorans]MBH5329796.1 hypothetical protein [Eikenella glucosivorans]